MFFFLIVRHTPKLTPTSTLFSVTTLLRSVIVETDSLVGSLVVHAIEFVVSSILYRRDNIGLPSRAARVDRNCFIADIYLGAVGVHQEGQNVPLEVRMGIGRVVMSASPRCLLHLTEALPVALKASFQAVNNRKSTRLDLKH